MRNINRFLVFLIISLVSVSGFSQTVDSPTEKKDESSKSQGLKKITNNANRNWNVDVRIDEVELEARIESAIKDAMESLEVSLDRLEKLEISIEPIEIELGDLNLDSDLIKIAIPRFDIDIEPIIIDLDDIEMDDDDFEFNDNGDEGDEDDNNNNDGYNDKEKNKNKNDKVKDKSSKDKSDKSEQKEKDKSKGLKKIN